MATSHTAGRERDVQGPLQEREVQRYYQPWLLAQGSSFNVASYFASIGQRDLSSQGYKPQSSKDVALTAFAQLAVLRLSVRRAMVSLIDSRNQMILAEATRDSSLTGANDLWLGSSVIARSIAVCEHCFINTCSSRGDDGPVYSCQGLIVDDCRLDGRFKDRSYVVDEPGVRFYAGVPITTRSGRHIGAYAVSDDAPRNGLSRNELQFLESTAKAVMEHLEWARDRVDRFRGERIVQGMASFIEGGSSIESPIEAANVSSQDQPASCASPTNHSAARPLLTTRRSFRAQPKGTTVDQSSKPSSTSGKTDNYGLVYQRAANIMRESVLADGVAIFNAAPGTRLDSSSNSVPSSAATSVPAPSGPSPGSDSSRYDTSDSDSNLAAQSCMIMALSLAKDGREIEISKDATIPLATLNRYHNSYPQGKTFYFGDEGSGISSGDESSTGSLSKTQTTSHRRRNIDHRDLLSRIPDAKVVCFLPLYDSAEEKLMAGCFLWTSVTGQMMEHDNNLGYLRAFANSVMSEIARVRTQKNEMAKTTFIASMSHELRSPLHGILGAVELLKDTTLDSFQTGLVSSVSTCGRTLLDTLNHVLDYSKINKLGKSSMRRLAKQSKAATNATSESPLESLTITADVDLGTLVEEVMDATTSGHAFKRFPGSIDNLTHGLDSNGSIVADGKRTAASQSTDSLDAAVSVLLDITPNYSWQVRTQPGAIRRIIMNLLGNALKYTPRGFIATSLRAQESRTWEGKVDALIRVVDSGKGMSEEFLRDRLFMPFSQEDSFQPGTGLGLSIVKQIVDSLGGSIEVRSQQNVGTEVSVRLSFAVAKTQQTQPQDDELRTVASQTKGQHVVLLNPFSLAETPILSARASRQEETLRALCTSWFDMSVTRSSVPDINDASFYIYHEPPPIEKLLEVWDAERASIRPRRDVPIIMICMNPGEAADVNKSQGQALKKLGYMVEAVAQPCGPRKLAKVLKAFMLLKRDASINDISPNNDKDRVEAMDEPAIQGAMPNDDQGGTAASNPATRKDRGDPRHHQDLRSTLNAAVSFPSPPPIDPATPAWKVPSRTSGARTTDAPHAVRCLVVDDNKINLQLLVMFMRKQKIAYTEAENGQEALDRFKEAFLPGPGADGPGRLFDVILMDINMPVMDGMEATKRIREFEDENGIPRTTIIALTGLASAQAQEEALAAGIDVFLPKPVKFARLQKLLVKK